MAKSVNGTHTTGNSNMGAICKLFGPRVANIMFGFHRSRTYYIIMYYYGSLYFRFHWAGCSIDLCECMYVGLYNRPVFPNPVPGGTSSNTPDSTH